MRLVLKMMIPVQMPEGARLRSPAPDHATLEAAEPGSRLRVCTVRGQSDLRRRLLEMGFVSGTPLSDPPETGAPARFVAIAGNPNSGKTSVFNCLTGQRRKVGNYPGVTVERIEGRLTLPDGTPARLVDLPGCYSLFARSEDERIARNVLLGLVPGTARPDVVICVVDASNLERNLYLTTQLLESGVRVCVALTMADVADRAGAHVDPAVLSEALEVPVVAVNGRTGHNLDELRAAIRRARAPGRRWRLPEPAERAIGTVREAVAAAGLVVAPAQEGEAIRLLTQARDGDPFLERGGPELHEAVTGARRRLEEAGIDRAALEAECRYALCSDFAGRATQARRPPGVTLSERIDRVATHRVLGPILYLGLLALIFRAVYSWAEPFMNWIEAGTGWCGEVVGGLLGP
ncbi:MAG: FeoB small GTPase domain-containing protein, partial [Planctomycetota bacterium]